MIFILNLVGHLFFEQIQEVVSGYDLLLSALEEHSNDETLHKTVDGNDVQYIQYTNNITKTYNYTLESNGRETSISSSITDGLIQSVKESIKVTKSKRINKGEKSTINNKEKIIALILLITLYIF